MSNVFERVLAEYTELNEKVTRLDDFIHNSENEEFDRLSVVQRVLLISQLDAMKTYRHILSLRLSDWDGLL